MALTFFSRFYDYSFHWPFYYKLLGDTPELFENQLPREHSWTRFESTLLFIWEWVPVLKGRRECEAAGRVRRDGDAWLARVIYYKLMSLFLERSLEVQLLASASFNCNALKQLFSRELGQRGVHLSTRRSSDAAERWERASRVVPSASADSSARRPDLTDRSFLQLYILGNCTTESELYVNKARRAHKLTKTSKYCLN